MISAQFLQSLRICTLCAAALPVSLLGAEAARAADLFSVEIAVNPGAADFVTGRRSIDEADQLVDFFEDINFEPIAADERFINDPLFVDVDAAYTNTSIAGTTLFFRGVGIVASFESEDDPITLRIPSLDFVKVFDGEDREDSADQLIDFLEANGEGILTEILQTLVAETAVDPVAGNPNSLQSQMVASDFSMGTSVGPELSFSAASAVLDAAAAGEDAPNLIGLQARFGHASADDFDQDVVTLPISYVVPLADPRYAVHVDAPITYLRTEDTDTFAGSFGIGFRVPVIDDWSLTPAVRVGAVGSTGLGALAVLYNGSITSNYEREFGGIRFALGNSFSAIFSAPLSIADVDYDYDLTNYVLRNGIELSGDTGWTMFAEPVTWEASVVNTQFFGDELYVENATDLSVSIGTEASRSGLTWDSLRVGFTYTFTDSDFQGFRLNFGYQF